MAIWATIWATYDTARLVGLRPMARRIAPRGRRALAMAGPVCPYGRCAVARCTAFDADCLSVWSPGHLAILQVSKSPAAGPQQPPRHTARLATVQPVK